MATYNSPQVKASGGPSTFRSGVGPGIGNDIKALVASVTVSAAPAAGDLFNLFVAPKGFRITDGWFKASGMDEGENLAFDVGDAGDPNRFIAAAVGYTLSVQPMTLVGAFGYKFTEDTLITASVETAPGTGSGTAGTLSMCLRGVIEGVTS